jgi:hypothetical protein
MAACSNFGRSSNAVPQLPLAVYALIVDEPSEDWDPGPSSKNLTLARNFLLPLCQRQLVETDALRSCDIINVLEAGVLNLC